MSNFLETIPESEAQGAVGDLYEGLRAALDHLPNYGLTFGQRPELWDAWRLLARTVVSNMDLRRYELATLAAAVTLKSSYCALAHGEKLLDLGSTEDEVRSIALGPLAAGLPEVEQAIVDYAAKIARDASTVTQEDIDQLRGHGLSDREIFDVASAAAIRCFFSKLLDAVGTKPDNEYLDRIPELASYLQVGRPVEGPG